MYSYPAMQLPQMMLGASLQRQWRLPQAMLGASLQRQGRSRLYLSLLLANVNRISLWLPSLFSLIWCSNQSGQTNSSDSRPEDLGTDNEVPEPLAYTTEDTQLDVPAVEFSGFWMQEQVIESTDITSASAYAFDVAESRCLRHCWTSNRNAEQRCLVGCWQECEPDGRCNLDSENGGDI